MKRIEGLCKISDSDLMWWEKPESSYNYKVALYSRSFDRSNGQPDLFMNESRASY
jgi:hypothetical protein